MTLRKILMTYAWSEDLNNATFTGLAKYELVVIYKLLGIIFGFATISA